MYKRLFLPKKARENENCATVKPFTRSGRTNRASRLHNGCLHGSFDENGLAYSFQSAKLGTAPLIGLNYTNINIIICFKATTA